MSVSRSRYRCVCIRSVRFSPTSPNRRDNIALDSSQLLDEVMMNSRCRSLIHLIAIVAAPIVLSACVDDDTTPVETRYRTAVQEVMARYHLPGALVSVRVPNESEWKEAFGYANLESRTPLDVRSHFPIRSITKSYTVTLILQLVRDKVLRLDDKLASFIPGIPNGELITIADLAGMQSGIADYSANPDFGAVFGANFAHVFTEQELIAYAIPGSPRFLPGAAYEYSNTNTVLLGMIVEKVTGTPMAAAVQSRILSPLALAGTAYPSAVAVPEPHATPYDVTITTGETEVLPLISPTSLAGAGAMVSTLDDLQTWAQALGDGRLIGADLQNERINRSRPVTNGPEYDSYGLGIGNLKGWWGHTGSGIGWQLATFYDPRSGATIAISVNATPSGGRRDLNLAQELFEALADVVATR